MSEPSPRQNLSFRKWQGLSGRHYSLRREDAGTFSLAPEALYMLTSGEAVLWVGRARDLIEDATSRLRFRDALASEPEVYRLDGPEVEVGGESTAWDLRYGHAAAAPKLASTG